MKNLLLASALVLVGLPYASSAPADREGHTEWIGPDDTPEQITAKAARVTPSARQLEWQRREFCAFVHFGMNTFTDREWGDGKEDPKLFNPTGFDARQWIAAAKDAGMTELILTAKHHDGFCLWPSKYTTHSVASSPWRGGKGDVVREVADACRAGGIKFGIYLSPWDQHEKTYGTDAYNDFYKNQLRELLTNYGPISSVWMDGAVGEAWKGKQPYDFQGIWQLVRRLQPDAVLTICGPDARWCGNEAGSGRKSEWSVVPITGADDKSPLASPKTANAYLSFGCMDQDVGSREKLLAAAKSGAQLVWYPSQVDTSIRPGWFYHPSEDGRVRSFEDLLNVYYVSVGGNSQLLLNIPADRRGKFHENDVRRLREIGSVLRATFSKNLAHEAKVTASSTRSRAFAAGRTIDSSAETCWAPAEGVTSATLEYDLGEARSFNVAMLQEYIKEGQRVEEYHIDVRDGDEWKEIASSTVIGYKRLLRLGDVKARFVRLRITQSPGNPDGCEFRVVLPAGSGRAGQADR